MARQRTDMHRLQELVRLHRLGRSARDMSRLLRMGRDTIRGYAEALALAGLLEGDPGVLPEMEQLQAALVEHAPAAPVPPQQRCKVEAWRADIEAHWVRGARPTAKHENVLLVGPTGVGKSHVAQALGERACRAGYSVLYAPAHRMLTALRASRADQSYEKRLLRYTSPDLLILDDVGLRPLEGQEPFDLYEVIRARYERGAMVLTSNRAVEEWYPLFRDELMASAAMDRLLYRAHVVVMEGHSFRNPPAARRAS